MIKLNNSIKTGKERCEYLEEALKAEDKTPSQQELYYLANYILKADDIYKESKETKEILTTNHASTVSSHETSFEGICSRLENGEDGIYNLISHLGKAAYLTQQKQLTEEDYENIPHLKDLRECITKVEEQLIAAPPGHKYKILQQLKDLRQMQYVIKAEYSNFIRLRPNSKTIRTLMTFIFDDKITVTKEGELRNESKVDLFNPKHISAILCNYSAIKQDSWGNFTSDSWYMMADLDKIMEAAFKHHPIYKSITIHKIDGRTNAEIQNLLQKEFELSYSAEYISSLWRNKIPKLIAEKAKEQYLEWYYTFKEYGVWKKCSRCGKIKLANNKYFSKNSTSKDGYYSMCKDCRNKKELGE